LKNIGGRKAIVVTDKMMTKLGVTEKALGYLKKGGMEVRVLVKWSQNLLSTLLCGR